MSKTRIILLLTALLVSSCGLIRQVPVETDTIVNYIDSIRFTVRDSIVVIPKERIVDIVPDYDTLRLETSLAKAQAYVDTTYHILKGSLEDKEQIVYKDRIIYKDKVVYKDSLVTKEIPVPYEVIKYKRDSLFWVSIGLNALILLVGALALWLKR